MSVPVPCSPSQREESVRMSYFTISMKKVLHYRWHNLFCIMGSLLSVVATALMWHYIYWEDWEMRQYMTSYVILSNLISLLYTSRYADCVADKVYKGTFAVDLLRPVSFLKLNFIETAGETAAEVIVRGIPTGAVLFYFYREQIKRIEPGYALLGAAAVFLAFLFYMMAFTVIGFLAFRFYEIWPFNRLLNDTIRFFSGCFIPLALFPAWMQTPVRLMPFQYLYSFPIELILKGSGCVNIGWNFAILGVWDIGMAAVLALVYRKALLHCVVQGG